MQTALPKSPTQEFTMFGIEGLVDNSSTDFDLFIDLERHFILYSGAGYLWQRDELTQLLGHGFDKLYIRRADLQKAQMYTALTKLPMIDKALPPHDRIRKIEEVGALFTRCLYEGELTPACIDKAEKLASSMTECVLEDPTSVKALSGLMEHDYYTFYHSVRVSAYAAAIAVTMGLKDAEAIRMIVLGGLCHDIGKSQVPLDLLNKTGALTEAEWKQMRSHPQAGHGMIESSILEHVPREIVLHHHEKRNGRGYPHGLDTNSLLPEVQIATLADIFDALTSARAYQTKRSRYEALDFIKHKLVREEVCPDAFRALVMCLGS